MSKKCPKCGGTNTSKDWYANDQGICCVCADCCYVGDPQEFREQTVFDKITESVETLADKFVYKTQKFFYDDNHKPIPNHTYYVSQLLVSEKTGRSIYFENEEDAIAATIKELKKEVEDE